MYYLRSRSKAGNPPPLTTATPPSPSPPPRDKLISLLLNTLRKKDVKNLKPILESVYFLMCSSLSYEISQGNIGNIAAETGFKLEMEDTISLSSFLLKELHRKLSIISRGTSLNQDSVDELLLLLRCSVLMVRLRPYDQISSVYFQDVVALLLKGTLTTKESRSVKCSKVISAQIICGSRTTSWVVDLSTNLPIPYAHVIKKMQEVYLDELFADRPFREFLAISDTISSTRRKLSICSVHIENVLQVITAHFLLSVSGKNIFESYSKSLVWTGRQEVSTPEVSLTVAASLINHPVVICAPVFLRAHLICMVSEVIGISVCPEKLSQKVRGGQIYLSLFCDSVISYFGQMSKLTMVSSSKPQKPGKTVQRLLESHFDSQIYDRVNCLLADFDAAWRAHIIDVVSKTLSSMASDAISYVEMNIYIIDKSYRVDVISFLRSLINKVLSAEIDGAMVQRVKEMTLQDFCLLASTLKLMSCCMLQAACCLKERLNCLKSLSNNRDAVPDYSSLAGILGCFAQYNVNASAEVKQFIVESLKLHHDEFMSMFVHFAGLLSLCLVSGLDVLVRGCLFLMLVILNIILSHECGSKFLRNKSPANASSPVKLTSTVKNSAHSDSFDITRKRTSTLRAASRFERARQLLLRGPRTCDVSDTSDEETCNGEAYLKYFTDNIADIADLADFLECKPRKDYTSWLVGREKYRFLRLKMLAKQRKLRKMKVYKSMASKTRQKLVRKT